MFVLQNAVNLGIWEICWKKNTQKNGSEVDSLLFSDSQIVYYTLSLSDIPCGLPMLPDRH